MPIFVRPNYPLTWEVDFDPNSGGGIPGAPQYAFAVNVVGGSFWYHVGPGATDWLKIGSGSGGAVVSLQVFGYTVTGAEPDPSEIAIALPVAQPDASYGVVATCQGVASIAAFDVAAASRTPTGFVLSVTGDLQAGDVVTFYVSPLT
jgi:hypothetical protein